MSDRTAEEGIGCRGVTLTAAAFIVAAAVLWTVGLIIGRPDSCTGVCDWSSFTLLFAGGPVSALFTVLGGSDLVVGWPVDIIAWFLLAATQQRLSFEAEPWSRLWRTWTIRFLGAALAYGGLLALFVSRVR